MKVLFLDVDGVLNSTRWWKQCGHLGLVSVDPACVERVRDILRCTGAQVVLTTTWRVIPGFDVPGIPVHDITPTLPTATHRGAEIRAWLQAHPNVTDFVILDDRAEAGEGADLAPHFIRTDIAVGLTDTHAEAAIQLLGVPALGRLDAQ